MASSFPVTVKCPLCSGVAVESFGSAGALTYHCVTCGFCANSDVADDSHRLMRLPNGLRRFVRRVRFAKECDAVFAGRRLLWWPEEYQSDEQTKITPIVAGRKLLWRLR